MVVCPDFFEALAEQIGDILLDAPGIAAPGDDDADRDARDVELPGNVRQGDVLLEEPCAYLVRT